MKKEEEEVKSHYLIDGSISSIDKKLLEIQKFIHLLEVEIQFKDLSFWGIVSLFVFLSFLISFLTSFFLDFFQSRNDTKSKDYNNWNNN